MRVAKFGIVALALTLAGCAASSPPPVVMVERPRLVVPHIDPFTMAPVRWYIVKKGIAAGQPGSFDYVFDQSKSTTLFVIDGNGFRNFSNNQSQIGRVIRQQKSQVKAYKRYYEKNDAPKAK